MRLSIMQGLALLPSRALWVLVLKQLPGEPPHYAAARVTIEALSDRLESRSVVELVRIISLNTWAIKIWPRTFIRADQGKVKRFREAFNEKSPTTKRKL
jgi:hypothetical protein